MPEIGFDGKSGTTKYGSEELGEKVIWKAFEWSAAACSSLPRVCACVRESRKQQLVFETLPLQHVNNNLTKESLDLILNFEYYFLRT